MTRTRAKASSVNASATVSHKTNSGTANISGNGATSSVEGESAPQDGNSKEGSPAVVLESSKPSSFKGKLQQFELDSSIATSSATTVTANGTPVKKTTRTTHSTTVSRTPSKRASQNAAASPSKRRRMPSGYAPPSKYAHLKPLTDILEANLVCVFVGFNPGVQTATAGHAYAHPSNHFWKLLHSSGLTDRRCKPEEDVDLPRLYQMGNTNIVSRPSKDVAELSKDEMPAGTADLETKFRKYRPEAVCIVGKGIWEAIFRYRYGRKPSKAEFSYGWQDEKENMGVVTEADCEEGEEPWSGAKVFVATSTSGLSANLKPAEKEAIWKPFGEWVCKRREERATVAALQANGS